MIKKLYRIKIHKTSEVPVNTGANPPTGRVLETKMLNATFQINSAKLYVPIVTLSINDNLKFLEITKQGFKGTNYWNKYRSEITMQTKNNNLD